MYHFKKCNKKDRSPCPRKSYDPHNLPHNRVQYSFSRMSLFDKLLPCLVVTEVTKQNLDKTLYIECMKFNRQLRVNFLAGKHNKEQYRPKTFLTCEFSASLVESVLFLGNRPRFMAVE